MDTKQMYSLYYAGTYFGHLQKEEGTRNKWRPVLKPTPLAHEYSNALISPLEAEVPATETKTESNAQCNATSHTSMEIHHASRSNPSTSINQAERNQGT